MLSFAIRPGIRMIPSTSPAFRGASTSASSTAAAKRYLLQQHSSRRPSSLPSSSSSSSSGGSVLRVAFRGQARRFHGTQEQQHTVYAPVHGESKWRKIAMGAALFGGTFLAVNVLFNSDGSSTGAAADADRMTAFQRSYLNEAFLHAGLGIGMIAVAARQMVRSPAYWRVIMNHPIAVTIAGLAASIGTVVVTRSVDPDNYMLKYGMWSLFNASQAALVGPISLLAPGAMLARAGLYTAAMMGGLTVVGATAREDKYLYIGGPLLAGACVVAASGLAPLLLPVTATRSLALMDGVWLYGGLALAGGFTLFHVQAIRLHGKACERGLIKRDPVNEAIGLELDFLNIFVRILTIMGRRDRK